MVKATHDKILEEEISKLRRDITMWAEIAEVLREKERRNTIYLTIFAMLGSAFISVFLAETLRVGMYSPQFCAFILSCLIFSFIVLSLGGTRYSRRPPEPSVGV